MAEQLLSTAVHDTVPVRYVRPESQRPRLGEVVAGARIPVVDLACPDRAAVVAAIGNACRSHGFFQVTELVLPAETCVPDTIRIGFHCCPTEM